MGIIKDNTGTDLDNIFERGNRTGKTGIQGYGGGDLTNRYDHVNNGSMLASDTGIVASDGRDLRQWFMEKGSYLTVSANNISASCGYDSSFGATQCTASADTDVTTTGGDGNYSWKINYVSGVDATSIEGSGSGSGSGDGVQMNRTAEDSDSSASGTTLEGTFEIVVTDGNGNSASDTFTFTTTHTDVND